MLLQEYLVTQNTVALQQARALLVEDVPHEPVGTVASCLLWLCSDFGAPPQIQAGMAASPNASRLLAWLKGPGRVPFLKALDDIASNRLPDTASMAHRSLATLATRVLVGCDPMRRTWDAADSVVAGCGVHPGDTVAVLGARSGYYTLRLSRVVGPQGTVLALGSWQPELGFIDQGAQAQGLLNVHTLQMHARHIPLARASVDCIFFYGQMSRMYLSDSPEDLAGWARAVHRALRPNGRLVIVDAFPSVAGVPLAGGFRLAPAVVPTYLDQYGFVLKAYYRFTPQRYELCFSKGAA